MFAEQIEKFQPNILFYPHNHKDHSTIGKLIEEIFKEMKEKVEAMEYLEEYEKMLKEEMWEELKKAEEITQKIFAYKYLVHHSYFPHPKRYAPDLYLLPPLDLVTIEGGWEKFILSSETKQQKEKALRAYSSQLRNPLLKNPLEVEATTREMGGGMVGLILVSYFLQFLKEKQVKGIHFGVLSEQAKNFFIKLDFMVLFSG